MGGTRARRLCPDAVVVPPRMTAYSEASRAVFKVFEETAPVDRPPPESDLAPKPPPSQDVIPATQEQKYM